MISCIFILLFFAHSATSELDRRVCVEERYDINRFYLYKAAAAPLVVRGTVSLDSPVRSGDSVFDITSASVIHGNRSYPALDLGTLRVDLGRAACPAMTRFKTLKAIETEYIFYLEESVDAFWFIGQPDVYKHKIEKEMKKKLFCRSCKISPPKIQSKWEDELIVYHDSFSLKCQATGGTPTPFLSIKFQQDRRSSWEELGRSSTTGEVEWNTTVVTRGNEGLYVCEADNFADDPSSTSSNVTVTEYTDCPPNYENFCVNGGRCIWYKTADYFFCDCPLPWYGQRCYFFSVDRAAKMKDQTVTN